MLARTCLHVTQSQCSTSLSLRAPLLPIHQGRALVVPKATYSARSSSPRSESWRSSWRTELEQGSNGNSNGAHARHDDDCQTAYISNGNGYHSYDSDSDSSWESTSASWRSQTLPVEDDLPQHEEEEEEAGHSNGWHFGQYGVYDANENGYGQEDAQEAQQQQQQQQEEDGDEDSSGGGGFFTDAFKEALKAALQRSPLYADDIAGTASADEEVTEPQPNENEVEVYNRPIFTDQFRLALKDSLARQQAELDAYGGAASDDEDPATPYVPQAPPRREMSPIEEVIATALGASQLHLRRLTLMKNEIDAALEREAKQIERLEFALSKVQSDMAYYKSLEIILEEERRARR